jgi:molybdenum cofactor biosynthesis protein B
VRAGVLTVSDGVSAGEREDASGDLLADALAQDGWEVERRIVPDDRDQISAALREMVAVSDLVLTTGGTGFGPRDVTPEATAEVLERHAPGIAEAVRADAVAKTPHGMLSRGIAGIAGSALIVNLPGSPGACRDGWAVLAPAVGHAVKLLAAETTEHHQT